MLRICETISEATGRIHILLDQEMVVANLNRTMIGGGELLLSRASQHGISSGGQSRLQEAASVVVCQAQSVGVGNPEVSGGIPAQTVRPRLSYQAEEQFPLGNIVNLSPRAGCLKQACPVR